MMDFAFGLLSGWIVGSIGTALVLCTVIGGARNV